MSVAFAEEHAYPEPEWAESLLGAHRKNRAAVGPVVLNANACSIAGWANFYLHFSHWVEPKEEGAIDQVPWHNSSYQRDLLLKYGSRLPSMLMVEGILYQDLWSKGYEVYLEPRAKTHHVNISLMSSFVEHAFLGGRLFAASPIPIIPKSCRSAIPRRPSLVQALRASDAGGHIVRRDHAVSIGVERVEHRV